MKSCRSHACMERARMTVVILLATTACVLLALSAKFTNNRCQLGKDGVTVRKAGGNNTPSSYVLPSGNVDELRVFVGVILTFDKYEKRMAIRQTWGADPRLLKVMFILSRPINTTSLVPLQREAVRHGDMVLVGHVVEDYLNIVHQTLEVFRAACMHAGPATHVMKVDDDSYVHVDRLMDALAVLPRSLAWTGNIIGYFPSRNKTHRWYTSVEEWPAEKNGKIRYAQGPGYVMTMDIAKAIALGGAVYCMPGPLFKWEDVAVGMWIDCLREQNMLQVQEFPSPHYNISGCAADNVVSHKQDAEKQRCMYWKGGDCC